jgi:hypothetical protein
VRSAIHLSPQVAGEQSAERTTTWKRLVPVIFSPFVALNLLAQDRPSDSSVDGGCTIEFSKSSDTSKHRSSGSFDKYSGKFCRKGSIEFSEDGVCSIHSADHIGNYQGDSGDPSESGGCSFYLSDLRDSVEDNFSNCNLNNDKSAANASTENYSSEYSRDGGCRFLRIILRPTSLILLPEKTSAKRSPRKTSPLKTVLAKAPGTAVAGFLRIILQTTSPNLSQVHQQCHLRDAQLPHLVAEG